jgi:hypothetical protein
LKAILASESLPSTEPSAESTWEEESVVDTKPMALDNTKLDPKKKSAPVGGRWGLGFFAAICVAVLALAGLIYNWGFSGGRSTAAAGDTVILLEKEPILIVQPKSGIFVEDFKDQRLSIHTQQECIEIFEPVIELRDYEIHLELQQIGPWEGRIGILYGVSPSPLKEDCWVGYMVELGREVNRNNQWEIGSGTRVYDLKNKHVQKGWLADVIPLRDQPKSDPVDTETIVLRIRDGELLSVGLGRHFYPELGIHHSFKEMYLENIHRDYGVPLSSTPGRIGIKVEMASVILSKAIVVPKKFYKQPKNATKNK